MDYYDKIADELDDELFGSVERCDYGGRGCILRSDPNIHPNRRYSLNNIQIVFLDEGPISKAEIKKGLA